MPCWNQTRKGAVLALHEAAQLLSPAFPGAASRQNLRRLEPVANNFLHRQPVDVVTQAPLGELLQHTLPRCVLLPGLCLVKLERLDQLVLLRIPRGRWSRRNQTQTRRRATTVS